jgi:hypothetical protein
MSARSLRRTVLRDRTETDHNNWIGAASIKAISITIAALGILTSVGTAYAVDPDCEKKNPAIICAAKSIAATANDLSGFFSGAKTVFDVAEKYAEMVGWLPTPPTLEDVYNGLKSQIAESTDLLKWDADDKYITAHSNAIISVIDQLKSCVGEYRYLHPDRCIVSTTDYNSTDANTRDLGTASIFVRQYSEKLDGGKVNSMPPTRQHCAHKFPPTPVDTWGCRDLGTEYTKSANNVAKVYDWRLALPTLMTAIAYRLRIIAYYNPEFFVEPDQGTKDELDEYRTILYRHYYDISQGIMCYLRDKDDGAKYGSCIEIHSGYEVSADNTQGFALYEQLPLYELKAMIDQLYLYTHP